MSLRAKFVAVFAIILTTGVGSTGGVLMMRHRRHHQEQVTAEHQLIATNAAFALKENLNIVSRELWRLSRLPEVDPQDNDPEPEKALLHGAHENSVFFQWMRVLDAAGRVTLAQPADAGVVGTNYAHTAWFETARTADRPFFYTLPSLRAMAAVVPIRHEGRFGGAIQGVLDLRTDKVLTPELIHAAGAGELAIVDREGQVLFPPDWPAGDNSGWARAFGQVALGRTGTLHHTNGGDYLYAYAPVNVGSFGVVFRWPWSALQVELRRELETTIAILIIGMLAVGIFGVMFASYLTRPLVQLGEVARRIAAGDPRRDVVQPGADEIGDLYRAFDHMEQRLSERDAKIREDVNTIRSLNATLEQRVAERTRELEQAQRLLLDSERFAAMGKTAAAIAHELKNALNGLGMCVDLVLSDTPPSPSTLRVRAQLHQEIGRLRDITESLLTFSRTPRIERQRVDLHKLIERALEVLREPIEEGKVTVETRLSGGGAPLHLDCDGYKVQGVLINLLKNAVESLTTSRLDLSTASPASLPVRDRRIEIVTRREGGEVIVEISDSGPGLSEEARRRLFEPFFTTKVTGTGLGLATARRVVEAHGGAIDVGEWTAGALFRIRLPDAGEQKVSYSRAM